MKREPLLNVPTVVAVLMALFALIHVVREYALTENQDIEVLLQFAFVPARYDSSVLPGGWPGGLGAQVWTFVTYAFLHANWMHLGVNAIWFLAFGSAVARRFGTLRFLAFFAVTAAGGAALHLLTHAGEQYPMIGASASNASTRPARSVRFPIRPNRRAMCLCLLVGSRAKLKRIGRH